jgi:signal transduction histidine kinase
VVLDVTGSPVAVIGLTDERGAVELTTRTLDPMLEISPAAMKHLAQGVMANGNVLDRELVTNAGGNPAFMGVPLRAAGEVVGMIGVANGPGYNAAHKAALAHFADQVAASVEIARLRRSRQSLVDTLVTVRSELHVSESRRLLTEERARNAERLERAQQLAIDALRAISSNLRAGENLKEFYRLLSASIAGLVGARRVLFWQLNPDRTLTAIPGGYGVDDDFIARLFPAPCDPEGTDLTSQVVYKDLIFRAASSDRDQSSRDHQVLKVLQVSSAISVPWRAGDERLGVVAAYDAEHADGFTPEDAWVLQITGLAAGLVWQLKQTETQLAQTVVRLQKTDNARQLLLKNLSSAVDRATKRFAAELHDDALQKLTAAELRLTRVTSGATGRIPALAEVHGLLGDVEEALRKLLFNVRPPALESPGGLEQTIRDRVDLLRSHTGLDVGVEFDLPVEPAYEIRSLIYRQVSEAITNIEKHADPSRVHVAIKGENDGVYGAVTDDGRGFIVSERDHLPGHLGLLALNERALLAGGWCKVTSEPGAGTIVEFWLPIPR